MTELTPGAQRVLRAWCSAMGWGGDVPPTVMAALAAVVRATADQVVPQRIESYGIRRHLLDIADDLKGHD